MYADSESGGSAGDEQESKAKEALSEQNEPKRVLKKVRSLSCSSIITYLIYNLLFVLKLL